MVTGEYPPAVGGVGDYTSILSRGLAGRGIRVGVLTSSAGARAEQRDLEFPVRRSMRDWSYACLGKVAQIAGETGARIVHIQYQPAAYQLRGAVNLLPLYLRLRVPRIRPVTTFHDLRVPYLFPKAGPLRKGFVRAMARFSEATVATNSADLMELGGELPGRRWLIPIGSNIPNSVPAMYDRRAWRESRFGASPETLVLVYFGLANSSKGVDLAVEAASVLRSRGIDVRLVIVGGEAGTSDPTNRAYIEKLRALAPEGGRDRMVVSTGHADPGEVSGHLLASDIAVLPFRDGASLRRGSLLAVLGHGLPVVTTAPVVEEPLLENGKNVLLLQEMAAVPLADAIETAWGNASLRRQLSGGAIQLSRHFDWNPIVTKHVEMYAHFIDGSYPS